MLAIVLSAAGSSPAFAVTRNRDGSYSVTLRSLSAIPAANRTLSQMGLHATLVQAAANCPAQRPPLPTGPSLLSRFRCTSGFHRRARRCTAGLLSRFRCTSGFGLCAPPPFARQQLRPRRLPCGSATGHLASRRPAASKAGAPAAATTRRDGQAARIRAGLNRLPLLRNAVTNLHVGRVAALRDEEQR